MMDENPYQSPRLVPETNIQTRRHAWRLIANGAITGMMIGSAVGLVYGICAVAGVVIWRFDATPEFEDPDEITKFILGASISCGFAGGIYGLTIGPILGSYVALMGHLDCRWISVLGGMACAHLTYAAVRMTYDGAPLFCYPMLLAIAGGILGTLTIWLLSRRAWAARKDRH